MIDQPQFSVEDLERMKQIIAQTELTKKPVKQRMVLQKTDKEGLMIGTRKDGKKCSVREDRHRYFFPAEWIKFLEQIKPEKRMPWEFLIGTGARINEIRYVTPSDIDWQRNNLTLRITKRRAKLGERTPKRRTFCISSQLVKKLKDYMKKNKMGENDVFFKHSKQAYEQMLKRALIRAKFKDWYQFSLHNIRKTHGNWIKCLGVPSEEVCLRLGHTFDTFISHYGSSNIFNYDDVKQIRIILGDLYENRNLNPRLF